MRALFLVASLLLAACGQVSPAKDDRPAAGTDTPLRPASALTSSVDAVTPTVGAVGAMAGLHVAGQQMLNSAGQFVRLHGVNRSSFEYMCISGHADSAGIAEGPLNQAEMDAMHSWHINAVRLPLNEDCWLGLHGINPAYSGTNYQNAVANYVALLTQNQFAVILNLHVNGDGTSVAKEQARMADRAHSNDFWTSVARRFQGNSAVLFDLYNEPHDISWACWRDGGRCAGAPFPVAGMQEIVNAIRDVGASNVLIATGLNWGSNLDQWVHYQPTDPLHQLVAGWHSYHDGLSCEDPACWNTTLTSLLQTAPIVATEIGEFDCAHTHIDQVMQFLDGQGQGYLAWAWTPNGGCAKEPSLITDWKGTPTLTYGQGYKEHLLAQFP